MIRLRHCFGDINASPLGHVHMSVTHPACNTETPPQNDPVTTQRPNCKNPVAAAEACPETKVGLVSGLGKRGRQAKKACSPPKLLRRFWFISCTPTSPASSVDQDSKPARPCLTKSDFKRLARYGGLYLNWFSGLGLFIEL